jgi:hypothetical protein
MATTTLYSVDDYANAAYSDALGIARRGRDLCAAILASKDHEEYLTSLYRAFRVPYKVAKDSGIKANHEAWSHAWHATTASLIAPMRTAGFKVTTWPNLRSGEGVVTIRTIADAAEDAKVKALETAERDAKDRAAFELDQAQKAREVALNLSLEALCTQIVAAIGATTHSIADVVAELSKHTAPKVDAVPATAKVASVLAKVTATK